MELRYQGYDFVLEWLNPAIERIFEFTDVAREGPIPFVMADFQRFIEEDGVTKAVIDEKDKRRIDGLAANLVKKVEEKGIGEESGKIYLELNRALISKPHGIEMFSNADGAYFSQTDMVVIAPYLGATIVPYSYNFSPDGERNYWDTMKKLRTELLKQVGMNVALWAMGDNEGFRELRAAKGWDFLKVNRRLANLGINSLVRYASFAFGDMLTRRQEDITVSIVPQWADLSCVEGVTQLFTRYGGQQTLLDNVVRVANRAYQNNTHVRENFTEVH